MDIRSVLRLVLLAAIWGGSFLFMRISAPVLGALPTAFGRACLGAIGLIVLIAATNSLRLPRFRGRFVATLALGAINSGVPFLMFSFAARVLPAGYSAILNATAPLMGVLVGLVGFGQRITRSKLTGMLLGLAGVAVLTAAGPLEASGPALWGVAECLVATTCYALAGFLTQRWITRRGGLDARVVALGSQIGAVALLAPFALWDLSAHPIAFGDVIATVWMSMLALGLLCTSAAYILYFRLIADIGPLKALTVTFLIPVFGVLWGWMALGEVATAAHELGGGLIAVALWLVLRPASPVRRRDDGSDVKPE
jgi:drug/metabolite transporter (DMT)-like permease